MLAQSVPRFQESEGVIIVEIESALDYGSWVLDTLRSGYTGKGYLQYKGSNLFNDPGNSLLSFEIAIKKTGKYRFQWHSLIAVGESNTEHNDSWLRFKDASDFYGQKNDEIVYPKGVGKTPNPEGSSSKGWLKIYQNNRDGWTWTTRTSDRDPHDIFVEFDSAGIYTLEVSGRSNGHAIDRLALYHRDVNSSAALDLKRPESENIQIVDVRDIGVRNIKIRPTIATSDIYLDLPVSISPGQQTYQIINVFGQQIASSTVFVMPGATSPISISHLQGGVYFIQFQRNSMQFRGKFIKI